MKKENRKSRAPLAKSLRNQLASLVKASGEDAALACIGVTRETLARALAGLNVHAGTRALVERALERLDSARAAS